MPWRPRMTIHAKVRTTTLVRSGSSTIRMMMRLQPRPDPLIEPGDGEAQHEAKGRHLSTQQ